MKKECAKNFLLCLVPNLNTINELVKCGEVSGQVWDRDHFGEKWVIFG